MKLGKRTAHDRHEIEMKGNSDSDANIKIITMIIGGITSKKNFVFNHSKELRCLGHCILIIYGGITFTCDQR